MYSLLELFEDVEIKDNKLKDAFKTIAVEVDQKNEITSKKNQLELDIGLANTLFVERVIDYFEDHEEINDYQLKIPHGKLSIVDFYEAYLDITLLNLKLNEFNLVENSLKSLMVLSIYRNKPEHDWLLMYLRDVIRKLLYLSFIEPELKSDPTLLNKKFTNGETLLMMEIRLKCPLYMIKDLLSLGVNPNLQDEKGCTPLMYAACYYNQRKSLVNLLKQNGADFGVLDNNGISYGKYYLIYKIKKINHESSEYLYNVGKETPSLERLEVLNSDDGPIKYFPSEKFNKENQLSPEEYFSLSKVLSENYKTLPIPLFIRNSPSWVFDEINYDNVKNTQPDLYQKIINWD